MRLLSIAIAEFRSLNGRTWPMSPKWNVVIGANEAGKSSLLDAIAIALQAVDSASPATDAALRAQVVVEWEGVEYVWRVGESEASPGLTALRDRLQSATDAPLFGFYRESTPLLRSDEWASTQAIERALASAVFAPDAVRLVAEGGQVGVSIDGSLPRGLSTFGAGVARWVGIVGDIAHRCCLLNPHLGADAPLRTCGIVLIDDIELHLHPNRQRALVDDLSQAFPEIQFIAASHSPFIVQSIHAGQVIDLDGHDTSEAPDLSIEDIAESLMGVRIPQRSKRHLAMNAAAKKAAALIQSADAASEDERSRIRDELNRLSMPFSNNQAFHAFLSMERLEAGLLEDDA